MSMLADSVRQLAAGLVVAAILVATVVVGQAILIPLAGAAIFAFMLAPVVRWLGARGLPKGLAVGGVLALVLTLIVGVTMLLSVELLSLTARISDYRENIIQKVRTVSVIGREGGPVKRAADAVDRLTEDVSRELRRGEVQTIPSGASAPVVVTERGTAPVSALERLEEVGEPLAKAALLILFTLFLLLQHQDMRDRIIRVFGTDNLSETTSAMTEAGTRLSRLFLAQLLMSCGFGLLVGVVLWIAGLPGALLWGVLSAFMRFVPFIGSYIAAIPPIVLAAGVDPGWGLAVFTAAFFVISEVAMGNLVEPMVLGRRVGLSPFAMIAAASFWTLVWGPVGLLLAAPLTVALVVLGRYIQGLSFLSVLLGDEPALEPEQELYHRLLSGDVLSAAEQIDNATETASLGQAADSLVLPALQLAASDARNGRLTASQLDTIRSTLVEATEVTPDLTSSPEQTDETARVLVIPARGGIDVTAAIFLARAIAARTGRAASASEHATGLTALSAAMPRPGEVPPAAIVVVTVGGLPWRQSQFIAERAERNFPSSRVLLLSSAGSPAGARADRPGPKVVPTAAELLANLRIDDKAAAPATTTESRVVERTSL